MPPEVTSYLVPVGWILVSAGGIVAALVGGTIKSLSWLRREMYSSNSAQLRSQEFDLRVTQIISNVFTGQAEHVNSQWAQTDAKIKALGEKLELHMAADREQREGVIRAIEQSAQLPAVLMSRIDDHDRRLRALETK